MVSGSLSDSAGDAGGQRPVPRITCTEQFKEHFPYYLMVGMTPEQYWDGDSTLVIAYRKADELRMKRRDYELWMQGMYFYEALCDASPIFRDFAKRGTKAHPYSTEPYSVKHEAEKKEAEEKAEVSEDKLIAEKGERFMNSFMAQFNRRFEQKPKEVRADGNAD